MQSPDDSASSRRPWLHLILALGAVTAWGASFAITRSAVVEIPPFALAFLRFLLAAAVLWPFVHRSFAVAIAPADRPCVFGLGFVGVTLYFACENVALRFTTASHAALIIAVIPLVTALAEARRLGRPPRRIVLVGLLLAMTGVGLLFGGAASGASLAGDALMIGAVACWVVYTFLVHHVAGRYPDLLLTWLIMAVGAATLLPPAVVEFLIVRPAFPSPSAWGEVAFLGIVCSALAYHVWNQALAVLGGTATNALLYGVPLVGVLSGVVLLGEEVTPATLGGGAAIVFGVFLAQAGEGRRG